MMILAIWTIYKTNSDAELINLFSELKLACTVTLNFYKLQFYIKKNNVKRVAENVRPSSS